MGINPLADTPGLKPADFLNQHPQVYEIVQAPTKEGNQYTMLLKDNDGKVHRISYLWERDLADLARHYGGEDEQIATWPGKKVSITAEQVQNKKDGKYYANFRLTAFEQKVSA